MDADYENHGIAGKQPLGEHEQSVVQLQEAAVQKDEESRALRRQLIAAGLDPCV